MTGLLLKLFVGPLVVILADALFTELYYPNLYQAISVGVVLAVAGHVLEVMLLRRGTLWFTTLLDLLAAAAIVYASGFLLPGAVVTMLGAVFAAILIGIAEYLQHLWLIRSGKAEKT
ncbi:hypothetical protein [Brevibacillus sp. H7]|uniref:hypothetical protein n=1 Tax=Brevibacillus sp. H7 TaxID=3349138 RepID=UPI003813BCD6